MWELTVWEYIPVFLACAIASTPIIPWLRFKLVAWAEGKNATNFLEADLPNTKLLSTESLCTFDVDTMAIPSKGRRRALAAVAVTVDAALLAMLVLSAMSVVSGSFNPFIYFRF